MQQWRAGWWVGAAAAAILAGCANSAAFRTDDIPDSLRAPAGQLLTQQLHAKGVQIYECKPTQEDATRFAWSLLAPEAVLTDKTGRQVARHFAGPTWEDSEGSRVLGQVVARANSPAASIPWLLLRAQSTSGGGRFGDVASIQRLHTVGGNAPPGCTAAQAGKRLRVPYSADYFFYISARS